MYVRMYVCKYGIYVCIYVCTYVCKYGMYICMYVCRISTPPEIQLMSLNVAIYYTRKYVCTYDQYYSIVTINHLHGDLVQ